MRWLIVSDGVITNIVVASESFAKTIGAKPYYDGAEVNSPYSPLTLEVLQEENRILKAQLQAQSDRADFIEDCIAEMAIQVYGGV